MDWICQSIILNANKVKISLNLVTLMSKNMNKFTKQYIGQTNIDNLCFHDMNFYDKNFRDGLVDVLNICKNIFKEHDRYVIGLSKINPRASPIR